MRLWGGLVIEAGPAGACQFAGKSIQQFSHITDLGWVQIMLGVVVLGCFAGVLGVVVKVHWAVLQVH